jgi:hypothetical protein
VPLRLKIVYEGTAGLKQDYETQIKLGGLFVSIPPPPTAQPLENVIVTLELLRGGAVITQARLTVATPLSSCVEVLPEARAELEKSVEAMLTASPPEGSTARTQMSFSDGELEDESAIHQAFRPPPAAHAAPANEPGVVALDRRIAGMSLGEKVQLALTGARDARTLLIRDRAPPIQVALLRNPKITSDEVLAIARSPHLSGDAADAIVNHPAHGSSSQVALALVRNPRTPIPTAVNLLAKVQNADLRVIAKGTGVRSQIAQAARKRLFDGR